MAPQRREERKGRTRTEGWCAATTVRVKQHVVAAHDSASAANPVDPVHPVILSKSSRGARKSGSSSTDYTDGMLND
jgi:hypothetical protein